MRNIPTITRNLLIINVLVFVATEMFAGAGIDLNDLFGLHFFMSKDFSFVQLFTYMFLHGGFTHILFNMFALWMFGRVMENVWGPRKFLFYYLSCGIGAGLMQELAQLGQFYSLCSEQIPSFSLSMLSEVARNSEALIGQWTTVGASGAIYGILLAFGMTFPNERLFIIPIPFPIKAKWFVMVYAAIELFSAIGTSNDGVAHLAHLGGMLFGYLMIRYWNKHPERYYNVGGERQFFDSLKRGFEHFKQKRADKEQTTRRTTNSHESDWEYNARKKARQDEVDAILDKIRKSGYDSLTKDEKKRLFDNSNDL